MSTLREKVKHNISATVAVLLFLGSVLYLTLEMTRNSRLENELKSELVAKESLLSEKLSLMKENAILKTNYKDAREKNHTLESSLRVVRNKLEEANQDLNKLKSQNSSASLLNKQNKKIEALNSELEDQQRLYQNSLGELQKLNDGLNLMVSLLQDQNDELRRNLDAASLSRMNDIQTEAAKKNNKLTVNAKRTKKLSVNLDVPANANNLNFRITDPSGKEFTDVDGTISVIAQPHKTKQSQAFYSESNSIPELTYNRVEMIYSPKKKLIPGVYTIKVMCDAGTIGSLQLKLR